MHKNKKFRPIIFIAALLASIIVYSIIANIPFDSWQRAIKDKTFKGAAWFRFDQKTDLNNWEEKIFKGKVLYSVKVNKKGGYLDAVSNNAASGIVYWLNFNPREGPYISWKWKVDKFPDKKGGVVSTDSSWIEKDDYAARFYVIFPRFPFFRVQCLEYVWDKDLPKDTVLTNPSFSNLKIMVIESSDKNLGKWVSVERNILEDFKKAFDGNAGKVGAIAIMTDTDNTASTAEAGYTEIKVGYEK